MIILRHVKKYFCRVKEKSVHYTSSYCRQVTHLQNRAIWLAHLEGRQHPVYGGLWQIKLTFYKARCFASKAWHELTRHWKNCTLVTLNIGRSGKVLFSFIENLHLKKYSLCFSVGVHIDAKIEFLWKKVLRPNHTVLQVNKTVLNM